MKSGILLFKDWNILDASQLQNKPQWKKGTASAAVIQASGGQIVSHSNILFSVND